MKINKQVVPEKKNQIFNLLLNSSDRKCLEEMATIWNVNRAEAIRRSISVTHKKLSYELQTIVKEPHEDNQTKILETILALQNELIKIHDLTETTIHLIQENKNFITNKLQCLVKQVDTLEVMVSILVYSLTNSKQIETDLEKITTES